MQYNTINWMHTPLCVCVFSTMRGRTDVINCSLFTVYKTRYSRKYFQCFCMKSLTQFPPQVLSPPHLLSVFNEIPPHTHHQPIKPPQCLAVCTVCPLVMAVPCYNGSLLIWHTVMQILGSTQISGDRSSSRSLPFPPWLCSDRLAQPGTAHSRIIVISHILCSQWCKTHHCLVFHCRHACFCLCARHADGQPEPDFHATASDIACNVLCSLMVTHWCCDAQKAVSKFFSGMTELCKCLFASLLC